MARVELWLVLASDFLPMQIKPHAWCMWEYRTLHKGMLRIYGVEFAHESTKTLIGNYQRLWRRYHKWA